MCLRLLLELIPHQSLFRLRLPTELKPKPQRPQRNRSPFQCPLPSLTVGATPSPFQLTP